MSRPGLSRLPPALSQALANRRLLIFAGAGISKPGPSFLPDWSEFNQSLLDAAKETTLVGLRPLSPEAEAAIRDLTLERIPIEAFSDLIMRGFAAEGYFSVLGVLDSASPNANHRAIADLARQGLLRAVITTNFDTLLERSFRRAGVGAVTVVSEANYDARLPLPTQCAIYKIHGSVTAESTLVDTVTQKLRGLPHYARTRLARLFATHHVLVLGYSGADLRFGDDYLMLSAIGPHTPGITWVTLPGRAPSPAVTALIGRLGRKGAVLESPLPELLASLGARIARRRPSSDPDALRVANARARERVRRFYAEGYVGPITSAAFCIGLLRRIGHRAGAHAVRASLESIVRGWGDSVPKTAGIAFRALGIGAMDDGDLRGAEHWTQRELGFWMSVEESLAAQREVPPESTAEWARNCATAWSNIGKLRMAQRDFDAARRAFDHAVTLAATTGHPALHAMMLKDRAVLAIETDESIDVAIDCFRRSIAADRRDGAVDSRSDTALRLARLYISLAEYDAALSLLDEAKPLLALAAREDTSVQCRVLEAEIAIRRGRVDAGSRAFADCLARWPPDSIPGANLRFQFARFVGFDPPMRKCAIDGIGEAENAIRNGLFASDEAESIPSLQRWAALRAALSDASLPRLPLVLIDRASADPEQALRQQIAVAEFANFREALPMLYAALCKAKHRAGAPARLLDLARAMIHSAMRIGDPILRAEGVNYAAIAMVAMGVPDAAEREYDSALVAELPSDVRAVLEENRRALRRAIEGESMLRVAAALLTWNSRGAAWNAPAQQAWQLAVLAMSRDDFAGAIAILQQGAALSAMTSASGASTPKETLDGILDALLRQQTSSPSSDT